MGISIAPEDSEYHVDMPIIPTLVDTGFNRSFSIHQHYLECSAGVHKSALALASYMLEPKRPEQGNIYQGHGYDMHRAALWLHRNPFSPRAKHPSRRPPIRLNKTQSIMVYKYDEEKNQRKNNITIDDIYPRLPLLGLRCFIENDLRFYIEGTRREYRVSRSFSSWLTSDE